MTLKSTIASRALPRLPIDICDLDHAKVIQVSRTDASIRFKNTAQENIESIIALGIPSTRCSFRARSSEYSSNALEFNQAEARSALLSAILVGKLPIRNRGSLNPASTLCNTPSHWLRTLRQLGWPIRKRNWSYERSTNSFCDSNSLQYNPYFATITPTGIYCSPGGRILLPFPQHQELIAKTQLLLARSDFAWLNLYIAFDSKTPEVSYASQDFPLGTALGHYNLVAEELLA